MSKYQEKCIALQREPCRWLVTGAAGFIGSHLVERLLFLDQRVVGIDNFDTGHPRNIEAVKQSVGNERARHFRFIKGDICDMDACREALSGVDYVLHQAAIGSVPRSMQRPLESHASNVDGFINVILAARDAGVRRVVYASSSSVYGSDEQTYKREDSIGAPLSPYAATKRIDEVYASAFLRAFGLDSVGLRYFNVFGARQDPNGPYAAVIARWAELLLRGKPCLLFGDGNKSRDFCYIDNVVQANLLAATVPASELTSRVMNIACGSATTLSQLFELIRERAAEFRPGCLQIPLVQMEARAGDIDHSLADISLAQRCLGYEPTHSVEQGLDHTIRWFAEGAPFAQSRCPATRSAAA